MKLMIRNTDGRILNWGSPPWSNQDELSNYSIVDVDDNDVPVLNPLSEYLFIDDIFIHDPEIDQDELDRLEALQELGGINFINRNGNINAALNIPAIRIVLKEMNRTQALIVKALINFGVNIPDE